MFRNVIASAGTRAYRKVTQHTALVPLSKCHSLYYNWKFEMLLPQIIWNYTWQINVRLLKHNCVNMKMCTAWLTSKKRNSNNSIVCTRRCISTYNYISEQLYSLALRIVIYQQGWNSGDVVYLIIRIPNRHVKQGSVYMSSYTCPLH